MWKSRGNPYISSDFRLTLKNIFVQLAIQLRNIPTRTLRVFTHIVFVVHWTCVNSKLLIYTFPCADHKICMVWFSICAHLLLTHQQYRTHHHIYRAVSVSADYFCIYIMLLTQYLLIITEKHFNILRVAPICKKKLEETVRAVFGALDDVSKEELQTRRIDVVRLPRAGNV